MSGESLQTSRHCFLLEIQVIPVIAQCRMLSTGIVVIAGLLQQQRSLLAYCTRDGWVLTVATLLLSSTIGVVKHSCASSSSIRSRSCSRFPPLLSLYLPLGRPGAPFAPGLAFLASLPLPAAGAGRLAPAGGSFLTKKLSRRACVVLPVSLISCHILYTNTFYI